MDIPRRRVTARAMVGALVVLVCVLLPSAPASAHTEMVASTPVSGAPVSIAVDRAVLTFSDALVPGASDVVVTSPSGQDVTVTAPGVGGAVIEVGLALREAGRHTVTYRVVGEDGHVVSGSYWFTAIVGGAPNGDDSAVSRVNASDASATADGTEAGQSPGVLGASATADASRTTSSGAPVLLWSLACGGGFLLLLTLWRQAGRRAVVRGATGSAGSRTAPDLSR